MFTLTWLAAFPWHAGQLTWDEWLLMGGALVVAVVVMWFLLRENDEEGDGDAASGTDAAP